MPQVRARFWGAKLGKDPLTIPYAAGHPISCDLSFKSLIACRSLFPSLMSVSLQKNPGTNFLLPVLGS